MMQLSIIDDLCDICGAFTNVLESAWFPCNCYQCIQYYILQTVVVDDLSGTRLPGVQLFYTNVHDLSNCGSRQRKRIHNLWSPLYANLRMMVNSTE